MHHFLDDAEVRSTRKVLKDLPVIDQRLLACVRNQAFPFIGLGDEAEYQ